MTLNYDMTRPTTGPEPVHCLLRDDRGVVGRMQIEARYWESFKAIMERTGIAVTPAWN